MLVYSTALLDESGRLVQNEVIPLEIEFSSPGTWVRALSRPVLRRLMFEPQLRRALAAEIAQRVARAELVTIGVATAVERRLSACLAAIDRQSLELVWQGSLFDRRADCQARMTHESLADVRAHLARRRASALALTTVHESEPRLVAAWLKN